MAYQNGGEVAFKWSMFLMIMIHVFNAAFVSNVSPIRELLHLQCGGLDCVIRRNALLVWFVYVFISDDVVYDNWASRG